MRNLLSSLCAILLLSVFSTHSLANDGGSPVSDAIISEVEREAEGQSVLGFNRYSTLQEIQDVFQCKEYRTTRDSFFKNSNSDWITHKCTQDGDTLFLQVSSTGTLNALRGVYERNRTEVDDEIKRIKSLIGNPTVFTDTQTRRRYDWGQMGPSDTGREDGSPYFFSFQFADKPEFKRGDDGKLFLSASDDRYIISKMVINKERYKKNTSFDPKHIWDGLKFVLSWSLFLFLWWISLNWHASRLQVESKEDKPSRTQLISRRVFTFLKIVGGCLVLSFLIGQGGETCASYDMYGCNEGSGEYTEPWDPGTRWEFFAKILGVSLIAWVMALKGYKTDHVWR